MPKLHKMRRRQKFSYNKNRKRVKKSQELTRKSNVKVSCESMKKLWDSTKAVQQNLSDFGLAFDANEAIKCKSTKAALIERAKLSDGNPWKTLEEKKQSKLNALDVEPETEMIQILQSEAAQDFETQKQKSSFRFTGEQVKFLTYMLDKHGNDFKAMAKDPKNHYQETPNQLRQKIIKFVAIPEQFAVYAKAKGILDDVHLAE